MPKPEVPILCLRGFGSFKAVISNGKVISERPLRVFFMYEPGKPQIVVGYAVTKNLRRAVDRNRMKRLMREAFRLQYYACSNALHHGSLSIVIMYIGNKNTHPKMVRFYEISAALRALFGSLTEGLAA